MHPLRQRLCALLIVAPASIYAQFTQQSGKLVGTGSAGPAQQGISIAVSSDGNTAIIGGPNDNGVSVFPAVISIAGTGAAWIFTRSNGTWMQQGGKLVASDESGNADFGDSVAISADGNTVAIGGGSDNNRIGAAWVFTRTNGVWSQQGKKLIPSGMAGAAAAGRSVALSADGNTLAVGGEGDNNGLGAVWLFTRSAGVWSQYSSKLVGLGGTTAPQGLASAQGFSVALSSDGSTLAIGGPFDAFGTGAVWIFAQTGSGWAQQSGKLVPASAVSSMGGHLPSTAGLSIALSNDGNTLIVSALNAASIFTRTSGAWSQQGGDIDGGFAFGGGGVALSGDGNLAIVGEPADLTAISGNAAAQYGGAARIFSRKNGSWSAQSKLLTGSGANGRGDGLGGFQGGAVALSADGSTALSAGAYDSGYAGATWVFTQPVSSGLPLPGGENPSSGGANSQSFTFTFNDTAGWQNLAVADVLINNFLDGRHACFVAIMPSSASSGSVFLVDDAGDAGGPYQGLVLGGAASAPASISNSQCTISAAGSSISGSGNTITATLAVTFATAFTGNRIIYTSAQDNSGANSNWQALGVWNLAATPPGTIAVASMSPQRVALPAGTAQTLNVTLTDSKGAADFGVINLLINNFIDGRQGCYLAYVAATQTLLLVDDSGDAGGPFAGNMVLNGSPGTIQNSQCSLSGTGSSAVPNGNSLMLALNITLKPAFAGNRIIWVAGRDGAGANNTDWQAMGTWSVQ